MQERLSSGERFGERQLVRCKGGSPPVIVSGGRGSAARRSPFGAAGLGAAAPNGDLREEAWVIFGTAVPGAVVTRSIEADQQGRRQRGVVTGLARWSGGAFLGDS